MTAKDLDWYFIRNIDSANLYEDLNELYALSMADDFSILKSTFSEDSHREVRQKFLLLQRKALSSDVTNWIPGTTF